VVVLTHQHAPQHGVERRVLVVLNVTVRILLARAVAYVPELLGAIAVEDLQYQALKVWVVTLDASPRYVARRILVAWMWAIDWPEVLYWFFAVVLLIHGSLLLFQFRVAISRGINSFRGFALIKAFTLAGRDAGTFTIG
jgi:hypothetical protein